MALLVKDANTAVQSLSTTQDAAQNLVPVHVPAAVAGGIAVPVSMTAPLPVVNAAGTAASDGSGTIATGGTAQTLFGGIVPANGWLVCNNSTGALYVSDVGAASGGGSSIQIAAGATFVTPSGYKPPGAVSIFGATTGQVFAARRW
jgi:hypothetical protein